MSEQKKRHSAGWYAGALSFWLIAFWLVTVGLSSIIPQIFWPEAAAEEPGATECGPAVIKLERDLLARMSEALGEVPLTPARDDLTEWLSAWDLRYASTKAACSAEPQHKAWVELGRMRHGLSALLQRFDREQLPRIRTIERTLGPVRDSR